MHAQLRIADNVLFQPIADEAVILNVDAERYYGLDDVATRAWQLLMEYGETEAVIRQMMAEYEVDEATLRQDITALVASMEQRGLIKQVAVQ